METIFTVRHSVLNMPLEMWNKLGKGAAGDAFDGNIYRGTASHFLETIGLPGGLTAKCTCEELTFFKDIHELHCVKQ